MRLESSFNINAAPDRVFAFLLDPYNLVGCVPGAQLTEQVDAVTFRGRMNVRFGPISMRYLGTGRLAERNDALRIAVLEGLANEGGGAGSGRGTAVMSVEPSSTGGGSLVRVVTEFTLTGRVGQLGDGVIEDVARRMAREVSARVQTNLETDQSAVPGTAAELNAAPLLLSVLWGRIRGVFGSQPR